MRQYNTYVNRDTRICSMLLTAYVTEQRDLCYILVCFSLIFNFQHGQSTKLAIHPFL